MATLSYPICSTSFKNIANRQFNEQGGQQVSQSKPHNVPSVTVKSNNKKMKKNNMLYHGALQLCLLANAPCQIITCGFPPVSREFQEWRVEAWNEQCGAVLEFF